jgi:hypothetical protein
MDRDSHGRFITGNCAAAGRGRPRADGPERLEEVLSRVLDDEEALAKWVAAFKRKLSHADPWATEFLWDRVVGKVPARQEFTGMAGEPLEILVRHVRIPLPDYG